MRPCCWIGLSRVASPPSNRANINASTAPACKIWFASSCGSTLKIHLCDAANNELY
jgi:hypothetical protein